MVQKDGCPPGWEQIGEHCIDKTILGRDVPMRSLFEAVDLLEMGIKKGAIEVNDGDFGDGNKTYKVAPKRMIKASGNPDSSHFVNTYLVLEEDDSVRFYFNPYERSDLELTSIPVILTNKQRQNMDR